MATLSSCEIVTHELSSVRQGRLLQLKIVEQQKNYDHYVMNIYNFEDDEEISISKLALTFSGGEEKLKKTDNMRAAHIPTPYLEAIRAHPIQKTSTWT